MKQIEKDAEVAVRFSDKPRLGMTVARYNRPCLDGKKHVVKLLENYDDLIAGTNIVVDDEEITVDE